MPLPLWKRANSFVSCSGQSTEAGGLIIGKFRGPHIEVTDITEPFTSDIRSRFSFVRKDPEHARHAAYRWKASDKTETFLGEWHTHPETVPHPSSIDLKSWRKLITANQRNMFFIILGTEGHWGGLGIATKIGIRAKQALLVSGNSDQLSTDMLSINHKNL